MSGSVGSMRTSFERGLSEPQASSGAEDVSRDSASSSPIPPGPLLSGPTRMCSICRIRRPKSELTRWVQQGEQAVRDEQQRLPGRGFYTCTVVCSKGSRRQRPLHH